MANNSRNYNWFIRISKTNNTQNGLYEYDFDNVFEMLTERYDTTIMAIHDKDDTNIHAHIILQNDTQIRFETLKKLLPYGDIEKQRGTNEECYQYLLHQDEKSKETEKIEYDESCLKIQCDNLQDWLKIKDKSRTDLVNFKNAILNGKSFEDLLDEFPSQMARYKSFYESCLLLRQQREFANKLRDLKVVYIYGGAGYGKTYSVYNENDNDYSRVYSVDNYEHPFDKYNGQDIVLFDEYRSNFKITYLLKLLDKYPLQLMARYGDKQACYTKVYIVSNISLDEQYKNEDDETKRALLRRITEIRHYIGFNKYESIKINDLPVYEQIQLDTDIFPF